ncbi:hypothetical protein [Planktotalea sp.]|uniref:hypothetical protein n=1 Tax=Planktotalea sp. TaxID=2029877 RepID=UPI003D6A9A66
MLSKGHEDRTCEHCGVTNSVSYTDYPERDKGEVACAGCGGVLFKWKGTRDYGVAILKDTSNGGADE